MFKTLSVFLFSLFMAVPAAFAMTQPELCNSLAYSAGLGAVLKNQGVPKKDFEAGVKAGVEDLKAQGQVSKEEMAALKGAIELGYKTGGDPDALAQKLLQACLSKKKI